MARSHDSSSQQNRDLQRLRQQLEEARATIRQLARERHEFQHLIDSVIDYAIFSMDAQGHILNWNRGARRMKGWSTDEIVGRHFRALYTPEDRESRRPEHNLAEAERLGHFEEDGWRLRKDGKRFWAHVSITAMCDETGRLLGFSKVTRDMSEARDAERARLEAAEVRHQVEMLREVDRMKDQFLSILSHELRTPINAIMGFGSVLDDEVLGPMAPEQHVYVKKILAGAEVLLALINDLLDISRMAAGKFALEPRPMEIGRVVEDVLEHLGPLADKKHQQLVARLNGKLPELVADPQRVAQVLTNIINNAIKFSPENAVIEVVARPEPAGVRVEVIDHGEGIAAEDLPKLFQRFVQLDSGNTRKAGGTGLGLSISKALIDAHGGEIGVESKLGEGSTFWFRLPLRCCEGRSGATTSA